MRACVRDAHEVTLAHLVHVSGHMHFGALGAAGWPPLGTQRIQNNGGLVWGQKRPTNPHIPATSWDAADTSGLSNPGKLSRVSPRPHGVAQPLSLCAERVIAAVLV